MISIIESPIFKFVIGEHKKEYSVHGAALSQLSKPLSILLTGPHKEAIEHRVEWPDVDEETFVRFAQYAYTKTYSTEEPDVVLSSSNIAVHPGTSTTETTALPSSSIPEQALYSLVSVDSPREPDSDYCGDPNCPYYKRGDHNTYIDVRCLRCGNSYLTNACSNCESVFSWCPSPDCHRKARAQTGRQLCVTPVCRLYLQSSPATKKKSPATNKKPMSFRCLRCRRWFSSTYCVACKLPYSGCPSCSVSEGPGTTIKRKLLIDKFLDEDGTSYPAPEGAVFSPRENTEGCEDYTCVFLCHAKLYVLGDTYDMPHLRQLSLHRLHATLKVFTLYPSRLNDLAALASYIFENTRPDDEIRDMITLYYACIVEDVTKHHGLKSIIDDNPEFALGLVSRMSERLE